MILWRIRDEVYLSEAPTHSRTSTNNDIYSQQEKASEGTQPASVCQSEVQERYEDDENCPEEKRNRRRHTAYGIRNTIDMVGDGSAREASSISLRDSFLWFNTHALRRLTFASNCQ